MFGDVVVVPNVTISLTETTMKRILLIISPILLFAACKKSAPPPPAEKDTATVATQVLTVRTILTVSRDTTMNALDTTHSFDIRDTIHGIIETRNATNGMTLAGRWFYVKTGQKIADNAARLSTGTNMSHFDLMNAAPWPVGQYKLLVLIDSVPKDSVIFAIENKR